MKTITLLVLVGVMGLIFEVRGQGSLTPPGPPGPTMKTLHQLEPRTPIAAIPYVITNSGSFYLTGNLAWTGGVDGITIAANGVTLDLGGFAIIGGGGGSGSGIMVAGGRTNLCIRNGTLTGWGGAGVSADNATASRFLELRAVDNEGWGIAAGERNTLSGCVLAGNTGGVMVDIHSLLEGCLATRNLGVGLQAAAGGTIHDGVSLNNGGSGIQAGDVSTVNDCTSRDNGGQGITVGAGCTINGCATTANGGEGIISGEGAAVLNSSSRSNGKGIAVMSGSVVRNCTAVSNGGNGIEAGVNCTVAGCASTANGGQGIGVGVGSIVENCAARDNSNEGIIGGTATRITGSTTHYNVIGISVPNDCFVADNAVYGNTQDGIVATLDNNRIEANNVTTNIGWGISISQAGNIIIRNSARGNGAGNYSIAAGNALGVIMDVSGGVVISNANPWANFSF